MKLLVALWALAGTASGLLPVIVPLNDDANGTQWGPVVRRVIDGRRGRRCEEREERREPPAAPARGPSSGLAHRLFALSPTAA